MERVAELLLFYIYDCFRILSGRQLSSDQDDDVFFCCEKGYVYAKQ